MNRVGLLAWLTFFRAPNALTTAADLAAGIAVAVAHRGRVPDAPRLAAAGLGLAALYAFGVGLNDWLDVEKDRRIRPGRPLPSGAIGIRAAAIALAAMLFAAALLLGAAGPAPLAVGSALLACILVYDLASDAMPFTGLVAMGACRAGSMTIGFAAAGAFDAPAQDLLRGEPLFGAAPAGYGLLVAAITGLSRNDGRSRVGPGALVAAAVVAFALLLPGIAAARAVLLLLGVLLAARILHPLVTTPPRFELAVRNGVFSLPFAAALWCLAAGGPAGVGGAIAAISTALVVRAAAKWIRQRES